MCPKCKKSQYCGCKSCKQHKGMNRLRSSTFMGDFIKCGYCRTIFSFDAWEDFGYLKSIKLMEVV